MYSFSENAGVQLVATLPGGLRQAQKLAREGHIVLLERDWYIVKETWQNFWIEKRQKLLALSHNKSMTESVFSHYTAAAIHGLPLYGHNDLRIHVTCLPGSRVQSSRKVFRHSSQIASHEIIEKDGLLCTSIQRTLLDLARYATQELSLAAVDAALNELFMRGHTYNGKGAQVFTGQLLAKLDSMCGMRGVRRARNIIALADGRADSVIESISRLQLLRVGFGVELQVAVENKQGGSYFLDFEFLGHEAFGEVDGLAKYFDGGSPREALLAEKEREDWIRGTTGKRILRWGSRDIVSPEKLATRLASFGLRP